MNAEVGLERCLTFIQCQLQPPQRPLPAYRDGAERRAITLSRQTGSGGSCGRRTTLGAAPGPGP